MSNYRFKTILHIIAFFCFSLSVNSQPLVNFISQDETCPNECNGHIIFEIDKGQSEPNHVLPFDLDYENTLTGEVGSIEVNSYTFSLDNLCGGVYGFILHLDDFCSYDFQVEIEDVDCSICPLLAIEIVNLPTGQFFCTNGAINLNISGGTPPYQIEWTSPIWPGSIYSQNLDGQDLGWMIPNILTEFNVSVTDVLGCVVSSSINITCCSGNNNSLNLNIEVQNSTTDGYCVDGILDLEVLNSSGPFIYSWESTLWQNNVNVEDISEQYLQNMVSGETYNFCVTVTDYETCQTGTACEFLSCCPRLPEATISNVCNGRGSIDLDWPNGVTYYVDWSGPNSFYDNNPFGISNLESGTYTASFLLYNGHCAYEKEYVVEGCGDYRFSTIRNPIRCGSPENIPGQIEIEILSECNGTTPIVTWYDRDNPGVVVGTGLSTSQLDGQVSYYAQIDFGDGCIVTTNVIYITCCSNYVAGLGPVSNYNSPTINVKNLKGTFDPIDCNGSAEFDSSDGGTGISLVKFFKMPGYVEIDNLSGLCEGEYCIEMSNGCESIEECFNIVDCNNEDPIVITEDGLSHTCPDESCGFISVKVTGGSGEGFTYKWNDNASISDSRSSLAAGTYIITVSDIGQCGSTSTRSFIINDNEQFFPLYDENDTDFCLIELFCKDPNSNDFCFIDAVNYFAETVDSDDCRFEILECIDRDEFLGMGPDFVFATTTEKTSTIKTNSDEDGCYSFVECDNGTEFNKPFTRVHGTTSTIQQKGYRTDNNNNITCFYCLERLICEIEGEETMEIENESFAMQGANQCSDCSNETVFLYCDWNSDGLIQNAEIVFQKSVPVNTFPSIPNCDPTTVPLPLSPEIDTEVRNTGKEIKIYPNPVSQRLYVDIPSENKFDYVIVSSTGKQIVSSSCTSASINVSFLNSGFYYLQIKTMSKYEVHSFIKL